MSSAENVFESLPRDDGYTHLLGVPMELVDQLRVLYDTALDGPMSLSTWRKRHRQVLAGHEPALPTGDLSRAEAQVSAASKAVTEDFDRFLFLGRLAANLRLLQEPDPEREMRELQDTLPNLTGEASRMQIERRLGSVRAMTGHSDSDFYEPATRMFKALQVGTLEETYRWLQAALAQNPAASVQDLLTRAAIEVAEAKLELDRYDDLKDHGDDRQR